MQFQMSSMRVIGNPVAYFNLYPGRFISAHVHGVDLIGPAPEARGPQMPVKPDPNAAGRGRTGGAAPAGPPATAVGDDSVNWQAVFTAAKIAHLNRLPQGRPEWARRVKGMVDQMDAEAV